MKKSVDGRVLYAMREEEEEGIGGDSCGKFKARDVRNCQEKKRRKKISEFFICKTEEVTHIRELESKHE